MPSLSTSTDWYIRSTTSDSARSIGGIAFMSSVASISRTIASARAVIMARSAFPSPAMSWMIFWSLGLRTTSSRRRSAGFFAGPSTA